MVYHSFLFFLGWQSKLKNTNRDFVLNRDIGAISVKQIYANLILRKSYNIFRILNQDHLNASIIKIKADVKLIAKQIILAQYNFVNILLFIMFFFRVCDSVSFLLCLIQFKQSCLLDK